MAESRLPTSKELKESADQRASAAHCRETEEKIPADEVLTNADLDGD